VFLLDVANWVILKSKLGGTIQAVVAALLHTKECYGSSVTGCKHTARDEASITGQLETASSTASSMLTKRLTGTKWHPEIRSVWDSGHHVNCQNSSKAIYAKRFGMFYHCKIRVSILR